MNKSSSSSSSYEKRNSLKTCSIEDEQHNGAFKSIKSTPRSYSGSRSSLPHSVSPTFSSQSSYGDDNGLGNGISDERNPSIEAKELDELVNEMSLDDDLKEEKMKQENRKKPLNALIHDCEDENEDVDDIDDTINELNAQMISKQFESQGDEQVLLITESVRVPSSGKSGSKIKSLRATTNTCIKTPLRNDEPVFVIIGKPGDVQHAIDCIQDAANHFIQLSAAKREPKAGEVTISVKVPRQYVGVVVGRNGSVIMKIKEQTHTRINTPRSPNPIAEFEVTGTTVNVISAQEAILEKVRMAQRLNSACVNPINANISIEDNYGFNSLSGIQTSTPRDKPLTRRTYNQHRQKVNREQDDYYQELNQSIGGMSFAYELSCGQPTPPGFPVGSISTSQTARIIDQTLIQSISTPISFSGFINPLYFTEHENIHVIPHENFQESKDGDQY